MSTLLAPNQTAPTISTKTAARIPTLDGWRGVAILLVLADHTSQYGQFRDRQWANFGSFGVDIFFVLSGYIITARLIREHSLHGRIDLRGFYVRRAFRILPLVVLYLAILGFISRFIHLGDFHWQELAGSLFFFRNYQIAADPRGMYTLHFWSLSVEEHFYLVWPAIFLWARNKYVLWLAVCGAVISALWRSYELSHANAHLLPSAVQGLQILQTDARLDGLLLGSALAIALTSTRLRNFLSTNLPKESYILLLPALVVALLLSSHRPSLTLNLLIALTVAFTLITKEGPVFWLLNLWPLVWIGEISYSLYIWQELFLFRPSGYFPLGYLSIFPLNIVCVFVVASCSFYFLERPAIAIGKRLYVRNVNDPPPPPADGAAMMI